MTVEKLLKRAEKTGKAIEVFEAGIDYAKASLCEDATKVVIEADNAIKEAEFAKKTAENILLSNK